MDAVDLKTYIKNNDRVVDVLKAIGCHSFKETPQEIRCALPNHRNSTSVCVKLDTLYSIVYAPEYKTKGDILSLVMTIKDISFSKAVKYVHEILGLEYSYTKKKQKETVDVLDIFKKHKGSNKKSKRELKTFELPDGEYIFSPHLSLVKEGIIPSVQKEFGIGYDIRSRRILFPHLKWDGDENDYVGLIGRTTIPNHDLLEIPKYFPLIPYQKSLNIYGLQQNYKHIQEAGYVVVVEAEKSVLKRATFNDRTCVAVCGHEISEEQVRILISLNVEIIIAFDNDIVVDDIREQCDKFYSIRPISYVKDFWKVLGEKDSPCDTINDMYNFMIKNRVKYNDSERKKTLDKRKKGQK